MEIRTLHDVAASVRGRRVGLRLTQQTLATRAGVSRSFVSDLEAGKPTVELRRVIAVLEALGYSLDLETADPETTVAEAGVNLDEVLDAYDKGQG